MRNYRKCNTCNEYHWTNEPCAPIYFIYHEEYLGDEPKEIRAYHHEGAAQKYGEYYNENDYPLMNGDTIKIKVEHDGVVEFYEVGAEPDIHYTTNEIKEKDYEQTN